MTGLAIPPAQGPMVPHPFSSLVSLCDFYDASLSLAQKTPAVYPAKAIAYMWARRGSYFEPAYLKAFIQMMGIYPAGSLVRLEGGELAIVTLNHPQNLHRPQVRLIPSSTREPSRELNLLETSGETGEYCHSIHEALSPLPFNLDPAKYLELS
jgi:hypothetical protein